jgi:Fe-S-cluster-containing hydrogenase component 2
MAATKKIVVDESCINCDACSQVCPAMDGPKPAIIRVQPIVINPRSCIECGYCVAACPFSFLSIQETPQEEASVPEGSGLGALQAVNPVAGDAPATASSSEAQPAPTPRRRGRKRV